MCEAYGAKSSTPRGAGWFAPCQGSWTGDLRQSERIGAKPQAVWFFRVIEAEREEGAEVTLRPLVSLRGNEVPGGLFTCEMTAAVSHAEDDLRGLFCSI